MLQFRKHRYVPWIYWVAVVLISVVGTLITGNLTDHFDVLLQFTTAVFAAMLAATFAVWFSVEKTLSIHTIFTTQSEWFYWATILFTFALGTAAGDLLAEQLKLGYLHSAMVFGAGIVITYGAYRLFNLNAVAAFWIAYILTRPFGASFGDLLSQSHTNGGLGLALDLADEVARQLMARDGLAAHARDELGLSDQLAARPIQAALASAASFAAGAGWPLLVLVLAPRASLTGCLVGGSLVGLAALGILAAHIGRATKMRSALRILLWGAGAMSLTAAAGALFPAWLTRTKLTSS